MTLKNIAFLSLVLLVTSCSIQRMAVKQTGGIVARGASAFFEESDLQLAETALASNIKLLETLLVTAPDDETLLLATAQALSAYAFGFVEADFERYRFTDTKRSEIAKERARDLYWRARQYAARAVGNRCAKVMTTLEKPLPEFEGVVEKIGKSDVPAVFWFAFSWGGYINLSKDSITAVSDIVKVEKLMKRVAKLDENFFVAGPHMFLGVYFGSRPKMFGGDPVLAAYHLDQVDRLTGRKLLLSKVVRAQFLAVLEQDRKKFDQGLQEVLATDRNLYPEQRLMNEIAKERARILMANAEQLF